jgi:hypothetical protein
VAPRCPERGALTTAAYGFRISGAPDPTWFELDGGDAWPVLELERDPSVARESQAIIDGTRYQARIAAELPLDEWVHPILGRLLPALAARRGFDALHGGAILGAAGAWILLGDRGAGKSSLLGQCHLAGGAIAADDIVVIEGMRCLAGPRCVDLRPEPARLLGIGTPVREATKARVALPAVRAEAPIAGVVFLAWGDALALAPVRPAERLRRLAVRRAGEGWPRSPALLLDLAVLPAFELTRRQALDMLAPSAALLMEHVGRNDGEA